MMAWCTHSLLGSVMVLSACSPSLPKPSSRGTRGPLAAPRVVQGELDGRVLLGELPNRATKLGAGPMAIIASGEENSPNDVSS